MGIGRLRLAPRPREKKLANLILKLLGMFAVPQFKARFQARNYFIPRHSDVEFLQKLRCSRAMLVQPTVCSFLLREVG